MSAPRWAGAWRTPPMPSPPEIAPPRSAAGGTAAAAAPGACDACLGRTRLLELLAPHIERARHQRRLPSLLALDEEALLACAAGSRRAALEGALERFSPAAARAAATRGRLTVACRHDAAYPDRLREAADAPAVLHVLGA